MLYKNLLRQHLLGALLAMACAFAGTASAATIVGGTNPTSLLTQADADQLEAWLGRGPITLQKIFSHVRGDGKTSADFHNAADYVTHTFVVLDVDSPVLNKIGGFTGTAYWDGYKANYSSGGNEEFLFNLTTNVKQGVRQDQNAIFSDMSMGPVFGAGKDIYVAGDLASGTTRHLSYDAASLNGEDIIGGTYMHNPITIGRFEVYKVVEISQAVAAPTVPEVIAGTGTLGYSGDGGLATSAQLYNPRDVATDSSGNVYIADTSNARVRRIDAVSGVITTVAGTGAIAYNGDNIPATSANINPVSIDMDAAGNLYIADGFNFRIRRVDAATGVITTVAGTGLSAYNGDNIAATSANLPYPHSVAVDGVGNIFICHSSDDRIRRVDAATGIITTVAGTGMRGYYGDHMVATSAQLYTPQGIDVDSAGNLYIADSGNSRIRKVDAVTGIITTLVSGVKSNSVGVDVVGNVYYTDGYGGYVYRWEAGTNTSSAVAGGVLQAMGVHAAKGILYMVSNSMHQAHKLVINHAPVANAGLDQTVECTGASSANVILDGSSSSDPDGDALTYVWSWAGGSATGANLAASFPLGSTIVTLTVDDGNGATATDTVIVTVQDTAAPVVNAGADVTVEATSTAGAAYDVAAQVTATDNCCTVSTSITPVGTYPLGATTVTVSATDCAGNTGSDSMIVTVVDTSAPVLTVPADVVVEENGHPNSTVDIGNATATDTFAVTITNDAPANGYPRGTTVVTWTATDANGNVTTATQNVTVKTWLGYLFWLLLGI